MSLLADRVGNIDHKTQAHLTRIFTFQYDTIKEIGFLADV